MKLTHVRLLVDDFEACADFYSDKVGLERTVEAPGIYVEFGTGAAILSLYRRDLMGPTIGSELPAKDKDATESVTIFAVDDVDATYRRLRDNGVDFLDEPHDMTQAFIRVAHFRDPEGNLIEINHPLSPT